MGRRKKLAAIDRLDGNPHTHGGKAELPDFGVQATGDVFIPEHIHEDAQACIEIIRSSMPPTTYAKVDSFLLSVFATAWAKHKAATHMSNAPDFEWLVPNAAGTLTANPLLAIINNQAKVMMSAGDRLGLDPKARQGLRLPSEKPKSKFDGLVGGQAQPVRRAAH